jgi:membrane-associated protease RseP (regulator of RpoE activity)
VYAESTGVLDRFDATRALGVILMIRTRRGMRLLEFISKPKRFWRGFGEVSIWLCFVVMFMVVLLLILSAISVAVNPPDDPLPASDLLLIPGVTSFVPFWWPALALILAIVIHEYSHGIQARAHGMRLRSFGVLQLGPLPIGAFAEPEESEMERAPRRDRLRLFAAGPSINIFATYVVLILLSSVASGMVAENDGVHARGIVVGGGAEEAGLLPFETITHIDGNQIGEYSDFSREMGEIVAGDEAVLTVLSRYNTGDSWTERTIAVTMGDRYQYYLDECDGAQECIEDTKVLLNLWGIEPGDAFLGVSGLMSSTGGVDAYANIVEGEYSAYGTALVTAIRPLLMLNVPIANEGQTMILEEREMLMAGDGPIVSILGTDGMLMLFDFLFWLVWINFLLGFANLIPMIPFDGGHLVRDGIHSFLRRVSKKTHPLRIEILSNRISNISSIFILLVLLIPVIIPWIL